MAYVLGRQEKLWLKTESTFNTPPGDASTVAFVADDAVKLLALSLEPELEVKPRDDKADTGSAREPVTLRKGGSWSLRARLAPSGVAGTAPDLDTLLAAAYGQSTASASQVTYALAKDKSSSLSLLRRTGALSEFATGCVVDTVKISAKGDDLAEVEFSGRFADLIRTAEVTIPAGATASATSFTVNDGDRLQPGSLLTFGSEDVKITTMSGDVVTACTRGWHGTTPAVIASAALGSPHAPASATTQGTPSVGIAGSMQFNGVTHKIISLEHELSNNIKYHDDHFGTDTLDGFSDASLREVTFKVEARVDPALAGVLNRGARVAGTAIQCILGSGAGKVWTFHYDYAIGKVTAIQIPEFEEATVSMEFRAYRNAADEDEHRLVVS